jgi:hypothetical protein
MPDVEPPSVCDLVRGSKTLVGFSWNSVQGFFTKKNLASKRCVSSNLAQWRSDFTHWRKWISTHTGIFINRFWWYFHAPPITIYSICENHSRKSQDWLSTRGTIISCPYFLIYWPILVEFGIRHLHITLSRLRENRHRDSTFLTEEDTVITIII